LSGRWGRGCTWSSLLLPTTIAGRLQFLRLSGNQTQERLFLAIRCPVGPCLGSPTKTWKPACILLCRSNRSQPSPGFHQRRLIYISDSGASPRPADLRSHSMTTLIFLSEYTSSPVPEIERATSSSGRTVPRTFRKIHRSDSPVHHRQIAGRAAHIVKKDSNQVRTSNPGRRHPAFSHASA